MPHHPVSRPLPHWLRAALVAAVVVALHALVLALWLRHTPQPGSSWPQPIQTAFVQVLELSAPTRPARATAPVTRLATEAALALPAARAASMPKERTPSQRDRAAPTPTSTPPSAPTPTPVPAPDRGAPATSTPPLMPPASAASPAASAAAAVVGVGVPASAASAASADAPGPEWPLSTQLRYVLTGDFRGPLHGSGEVQWLRDGARYQVRVDVTVDPGLGRAMVSEGRITAAGLAPTRYVEDTRMLLVPAQVNDLAIAADQVTLPGGRRVAAPVGLQDSASQFVQLTWLLRTGRLTGLPGEVVSLPLALPDRVGPWAYAVGAPEPVELPFATVVAIPLTPTPASVRPNDWPAQVWFAPSLQHLPVRIRIQAGPEITVDLRLAELPRQAAPAATP